MQLEKNANRFAPACLGVIVVQSASVWKHWHSYLGPFYDPDRFLAFAHLANGLHECAVLPSLGNLGATCRQNSLKSRFCGNSQRHFSNLHGASGLTGVNKRVICVFLYICWSPCFWMRHTHWLELKALFQSCADELTCRAGSNPRIRLRKRAIGTFLIFLRSSNSTAIRSARMSCKTRLVCSSSRPSERSSRPSSANRLRIMSGSGDANFSAVTSTSLDRAPGVRGQRISLCNRSRHEIPVELLLRAQLTGTLDIPAWYRAGRKKADCKRRGHSAGSVSAVHTVTLQRLSRNFGTGQKGGS
jgi:hypothetical protein